MTTESTKPSKRKRNLLIVGAVLAVGLTAFGANSAMASTPHSKPAYAVASGKKLPPAGAKCDGAKPPKPKGGKAPTFKKGEKPPAPPKGTHPKGAHPDGKKPPGPPPAHKNGAKPASLPPKGEGRGPGQCKVPAASTAK